MQKLTRAEEEIMLIIWNKGETVVREVIAELKDPETPYTTVSTVIRILEKKGFLDHKAVGTTYLYYPLISKEQYLKELIPGILRKYFNGSFSQLASFFARENNLSLEEITEMMDEVGEELGEKDEKNLKEKGDE